MNCEEFENRILDYQGNRLSAGDRAAVEEHLGSCAGCRTFVQQLQQLDAALTRTVSIPTLPADFKVRLRERIHAETVVLPEAQRVERKRQMQAEYEAGLVQLGWRQLGMPALASTLRRVLPVLVAGCLAWWLMPVLTAYLAQPRFGDWGQSPLVSLGIVTLLLWAGVLTAFPQEFRRALAVR